MSALCGVKQASCHCQRVAGHEGPHVCDCAGAWSGKGKDFKVFNSPAKQNSLTPDGAETLGANLRAPIPPGDLLYDLWRALGGQEDDE